MSKIHFSIETLKQLFDGKNSNEADSPILRRNDQMFNAPDNSAAMKALNEQIARKFDVKPKGEIRPPFFSETELNKTTAISRDNPKPPPYELSIALPPGKKAVSYGALEIAVIKSIYKQNGIEISNGAAEAIAEKHPLDFTPKWDARQRKYIGNPKDGFYYKDFSLGKDHDMVLAKKFKNADGTEFSGYKFTISSDVQASVLADKDFALEATKTGNKAFLEKTFNERFGMTLDKALADLPSDIREKLKQVDAKTLLSAMLVGGVAIGALKKLPSNAAILVGGTITLTQAIKYGADANHIAKEINNSTKASDLPVNELKELITNGGLDLLLAGVGYAGGKVAPKIASGAIKLSDEAAEIFAKAARKTQGKAQEVGNLLGDLFAQKMHKIKDIVDERFFKSLYCMNLVD
ncbi:MAG: hypothetical protein ACR2LT_00685 [Pyrinomonadaceae bacterium]